MEVTEKQTPYTLGEILRHYREKCKVSQEFVAEQLKVSRQSVSKWELGLAIPSTSNLIAIAKLYNIPIEVLLNAKAYYKLPVEDADYEIIIEESEGGDNEAANADTGNKMSKRTKRSITVTALVVAAVLLVSVVVSVCVHNRNYYSNLLNISEQQLNEFIESNIDMKIVNIYDKSRTYEENKFLNNSSLFLLNFSDLNSKNYESLFSNELGMYYIVEYTLSDCEEARSIFFDTTEWRTKTKYKSLVLSVKSEYAEFYWDDKFKTPYIYEWYVDDKLVLLMTENRESGNIMINKLISFTKEETK